MVRFTDTISIMFEVIVAGKAKGPYMEARVRHQMSFSSFLDHKMAVVVFVFFVVCPACTISTSAESEFSDWFV